MTDKTNDRVRLALEGGNGNVVVVDLCPECARPVGSWHVADCAAMRPDGTQGARVEPSRDAVLREGEKRS
jgi:hypothetical protein